MTDTLSKTFEPASIEKTWYDTWEAKHYFAPSGAGDSYCIMLPPPNVTGGLHMGHGFQQTLMDALIRFQRMDGRNTLWQAGTDHAGIATQMVVERQLQAENISRHELGRKHFVDRIWEWKNTSGNRISKQMRRLGVSVDWSRERFTMDDTLSAAVQEVFIRLYDEGLIYRGKRLVNWDPKFLSAISDLEVLNEPRKGKLWYFRYPLVDSDESITIATTRPETMLGDVAVAVHPDDERYQHLIGREIALPLTSRTIPILADHMVDPSFGTGCVKITPAHDFNDYEMGKRHDLPLINILTPDAHLNDDVPEAYRGMERFAARKKIISDLEAQGLVEKIEDHEHTLPIGDRSQVVIEPYLTDQWYVKMENLAKPALDVVNDGQLQFVPANWANDYKRWLENIEDWCISRQLWWGHRIPAWYDDDNNIYVGKDEADVRSKYQLSDDLNLRQDEDVLDTWFSSALWPFSTLGWPEQTDDLKTFFKTDVLVTGFDIIFFWVARMVMFSLKFLGEIPFHTVYITGLIRDSEGHKMSKSKGNVLDPLDLIDGISLDDLLTKRTQNMMQPHLIEKITKQTKKEFPDGIPSFGTDTLRFTFCALASTTRDIRFDLERLTGYRNFCNKLWNAARYVLMNCEEPIPSDYTLSAPDRWILTRLQHTTDEARQHFANYRFDHLAKTLYEFVWHDYCDWYLELSKPVLYGDSEPTLKAGTRRTLLTVLETVLRLLHPIIPFITEAIWQEVHPRLDIEGESIMLQPYPVVDPTLIDETTTAEIEWLKQVITAIRTIRAEMHITPSKAIPLLYRSNDNTSEQRLLTHKTLLSSLAKLETITLIAKDETPPASASAFVDELAIYIPLAGLIDLDAEKARLNKQIEKLDKELTTLNNKLNNPKFTENAPADVVAEVKAKHTETQTTRTKLAHQLTELQQLATADESSAANTRGT